MYGQLLLSQAADLDRPPTQLELETELIALGKSGRDHSSSSRGAVSNARGGERGLAAVRSEFYSFQDSVKGELDDMKASIKEILQEVRKQRLGGTPPASSEVGTTGWEEGPPQAQRLPEEVVAVVDPVSVPTATIPEADVVSAPAGEVAEASPEVRAQNSMLQTS